jgi:hypothetical protein
LFDCGVLIEVGWFGCVGLIEVDLVWFGLIEVGWVGLNWVTHRKNKGKKKQKKEEKGKKEEKKEKRRR